MAIELIPLTEAHAQLLEKRGISAEIAVRLGWQSCEGRKGAWIALPFLRAGKVVNHKYRRINKETEGHNFEQDKGGEQCFYNLEALEATSRLGPDEQRATEIIITEGEMDCAVALQCGYLAASVPNGAPDKAIEDEDSVKFNYLADFPRQCVAVLAVDDDPAGRILRQELALRLGWHRCKWVQYPKGCKDLNEVYIKYGQKGVDKVLKEKSKFMNEGGLFRMSEIPAQPDLPAFECNIGNVSDMIKPRPGDLIVVSGIPSHGKSLFVNCLTCNMARDYGWNVCIASFEHNPRNDLQRYIRTHQIGKAPRDSVGNYQWSDAEVAQADAWIDKYFSFIVLDVNSDALVTIEWVMQNIKAAVTQYGARLVVIDPWNELDHDRPNGMSLTEYTGYAIKAFKRLAKQYMITVIIVAHPAKMEKNKEGEYPIPTLYDISDSSHWYNKSDIGVIIHRMNGEQEGEYGTLVRVAKVRDWGVIGKIGDRMLQYLPERGSYIDAPDFVPKKQKQPKTRAKAVKEEDPAEPPSPQKEIGF